METYQELQSLLETKGISFREHSDELITHCIFNDCDSDSRGIEAHLYINKYTGLYQCKKCGEKGNLLSLKKFMGLDQVQPATKQTQPRTSDIAKLANKYSLNLPSHIKDYLINERLIREDDIEDYKLGYLVDDNNQKWITMPVTDQNDNVLFLKLRQDPFEHLPQQPKYKSTGGEAYMYNARILKDKPDILVICEGELDCLVLWSQGVPAICSTAGAATFKEDWIKQLGFVREFYIVMDNDASGKSGSQSLAAKLAMAHSYASVMITTLPDAVGESGDVTDFFKKQLGTIEDLVTPQGKYVQFLAGEKPINTADFSELTLDDIARTLSLTIREDRDNKLITFLAMLSAFTHSDQINVSFNSQSSSGKTYTTTEIAKLFPESSKIESSGASPTSFFHGEGVFDKERNAKIVPLSRKILIFYEQPDPRLQEKLRSVLSHDQWQIKHRITNKDKKGANRAELIIIEGFPATIFCSTGLRLDEQEANRAILLSSETTEQKLKQAVHLQAIRGANEQRYEAWLEAQPERAALKDRILAIKRENVQRIIIPNPKVIEARFNEVLPKVKPRHMRDMAHLMKLIKAIALLNVWHRRNPDDTIVASQSDIDQAFEMWMKFIESQDSNTPPALLLFYKEYIVAAYLEKKCLPEHTQSIEKGVVGLSRKELQSYYLSKEGMPLNDDYLRKQILPQLENSGIIIMETPVEGDKRSKHIYPQVLSNNNEPTNDEPAS